MSTLPTTISESDVATLLGMSVKTLRNWRVDGKGPVYAKPGRVVVYLPDDVTAYLNASRRAPDGTPVAPPSPANDPVPDPTPVKRGRGRPKGSYTKR